VIAFIGVPPECGGGMWTAVSPSKEQDASLCLKYSQDIYFKQVCYTTMSFNPLTVTPPF